MNTYEFCARWVANQVSGAARVLDYGCGAGRVVALLREAGINAFGCDVFYEGGDYSDVIFPAAKPYVLRMEGERIPFEDASFDVVLSNQVFEHVPNLDAALSEISRVLKPGGVALNLFPDRSVCARGIAEFRSSIDSQREAPCAYTTQRSRTDSDLACIEMANRRCVGRKTSVRGSTNGHITAREKRFTRPFADISIRRSIVKSSGSKRVSARSFRSYPRLCRG